MNETSVEGFKFESAFEGIFRLIGQQVSQKRCVLVPTASVNTRRASALVLREGGHSGQRFHVCSAS